MRQETQFKRRGDSCNVGETEVGDRETHRERAPMRKAKRRKRTKTETGSKETDKSKEMKVTETEGKMGGRLWKKSGSSPPS